jgi:hypothetical protein
LQIIPNFTTFYCIKHSLKNLIRESFIYSRQEIKPFSYVWGRRGQLTMASENEAGDRSFGKQGDIIRGPWTNSQVGGHEVNSQIFHQVAGSE